MKKKDNPTSFVRKKISGNTSKTDSTYSKKTPSADVYSYSSKKDNPKKGVSSSFEYKKTDSTDSKSNPFYMSESITKKKNTPNKSSVSFMSKMVDTKSDKSSDSNYFKTTRNPTQRRAGKETEFIYTRKDNQTQGNVSKTVKKLPKLKK